MKSLKFNAVLNAFRMALTVLTPLITFPYTSRIFLTEGSGKLNFTASVIQVFGLFASLGIYTYGVREGVKVRDNRKKFSKLGQELLSINIVSTAVSYAGFFLCIFCVSSFKSYRLLLLLQCPAIAFSSLNMDWVFGVYEDYTYITIRQIVSQLISIAALFLFVHKPQDIYFWVTINITVVAGLNCFWSIRRSHRYMFYKRCPDFDYRIKVHLAPIFTMFAISLAAKVYTNVDTILLGFLSTDHHIGLYAAAVKLNTILITVFAAMSPVFMPRIIGYTESGDYDCYFALLKKIFSWVIGIGLPIVVGIEMLSDRILRIVAGTPFLPAARTMRILAPIVLINACANVLYYDFLAIYQKEKNILVCTVVGAGINILLSALLIPTLSENGAALGSLVSEAVALTVASVLCFKLDRRISKSCPHLFNYAVGCLFIVGWCWVCLRFISNFIVGTLVAVVGSTILYFSVLILLKDAIGVEIINQAQRIVVKLISHKK